MTERHLPDNPIRYFHGGDPNGEAILFLHAAFVDHRMFANEFQSFAADHRLVAVDIIGHGKSLAAPKGAGMGDMTRWLNEILTAEGIDSVHVVGVSLGAVLGQDFAKKYPQKIRSLACFGGYDIDDFDPAAAKANSAAQRRMMVKAIFSVKWFAKTNAALSAYTREAQGEFYRLNLSFRRSSLRYFADLQRLINRDQKKARSYPLLIGCGDRDASLALETVKRWHEREPDAEAVVFKDAGHCVNMDAPTEFNRVLAAFFKKAEKKGL